MPRLPNAKHELFCQYIAAGYNQAEAYEKAGYTRSNTNASTLHNRPEIQDRVGELIEARVNSGEEKRESRRLRSKDAETAHDIGLTKIWVLTEMMNMYEMAYADQDYKAALDVLRNLGREIGMFGGEAKPDPEASKRDAQNSTGAMNRIMDLFGAGAPEQKSAEAPQKPTEAIPEVPAPPPPPEAPKPPSKPAAGLDALLDAFQAAPD